MFLILFCFVLTLNVTSGFHIDFGVNLPPLTLNIPHLNFPKLQITASLNRNKQHKSPLKIVLPSFSINAQSLDNTWDGETRYDGWKHGYDQNYKHGYDDSSSNDNRISSGGYDSWNAPRFEYESSRTYSDIVSGYRGHGKFRGRITGGTNEYKRPVGNSDLDSNNSIDIYPYAEKNVYKPPKRDIVTKKSVVKIAPMSYIPY